MLRIKLLESFQPYVGECPVLMLLLYYIIKADHLGSVACIGTRHPEGSGGRNLKLKHCKRKRIDHASLGELHLSSQGKDHDVIAAVPRLN